ncbi:MAG: 1-acyl-sn-glycerol-3-phosphate acyltransferase [Alphaproteobacteria bacterium]|nr:1-acyl-sn-glycerol-3-phosphate acyltransferase [Alphaproteobacteria bacterium]
MIRSLFFSAAFFGMTALILILGSPLLFGPRAWAMFGLRVHAYATLWLMKWIVGTEVEVRGRENLPKGACLVAAKHQSAWDTIGLIPIFDDPALVMKAELMKIPLYGWFSTKFDMIPIRREAGPSALRQMLKAAQDRARDNRQILVFPEGTRRAPGALPDYKPGVLLLYDALKLPCVPVALNSGHFWPRNSFERRPGRIIVEILPPLPAGLPRQAFREQLIAAIEIASDRLSAEAAAKSAGKALADA